MDDPWTQAILDQNMSGRGMVWSGTLAGSGGLYRQQTRQAGPSLRAVLSEDPGIRHYIGGTGKGRCVEEEPRGLTVYSGWKVG